MKLGPMFMLCTGTNLYNLVFVFFYKLYIFFDLLKFPIMKKKTPQALESHCRNDLLKFLSISHIVCWNSNEHVSCLSMDVDFKRVAKFQKM